MVTTHCFSLQENPYLFTYRNSNYLPRLTTPHEKLEVWRGFLGSTDMQVNQGPCPLQNLWDLPQVLCVLEPHEQAGEGEGASVGLSPDA